VRYVHASVQLEADRVVSLHLSSGLLETNNCTVDAAQLIGAILSYLTERRAKAIEPTSGAKLPSHTTT
jgi:hypothetical protein